MNVQITLDDYRKAYRKVVAKQQRTGFFIHSMMYVIINAALITINYTMTPGYKWFIWPLVGWGFGLAMHYLFGIVLFERFVRRNETRAMEMVSQGI